MTRRLRLLQLIGLFSLLAAGCVERPSSSTEPTVDTATNVIFLIGDGMGLTQISAGMYANGNRVAFERMPVVGLQKTYSSDNLITDSAAGATAFSCGKKTYNGAIGVSQDTLPCPTLLERAIEQGRATGLVASSTIVHATPAAFFGHVASRQQYEDLAVQLAASDVDFFAGGGAKYFNGRVTDQRDLVEEMRSAGREVKTYFEDPFGSHPISTALPYGYLSSLDDPLPALSGRSYLGPAADSAISYLHAQSRKDGFFLMIEGSQIDWGGHANDADYIVAEMIEFSDIVDAALDYAQQEGNTLVVVTADHETGGFAINLGSRMDSIAGAFTSTHHTATMVPVFAYGPGAELFAGIYENTDIHTKLAAVMKLGRAAD